MVLLSPHQRLKVQILWHEFTQFILGHSSHISLTHCSLYVPVSLILSLSAEVSPKNIQVQLFLASLPQRTEGQNGEAHLFNFPGKRKAETLRS